MKHGETSWNIVKHRETIGIRINIVEFYCTELFYDRRFPSLRAAPARHHADHWRRDLGPGRLSQRHKKCRFLKHMLFTFFKGVAWGSYIFVAILLKQLQLMVFVVILGVQFVSTKNSNVWLLPEVVSANKIWSVLSAAKRQASKNRRMPWPTCNQKHLRVDYPGKFTQRCRTCRLLMELPPTCWMVIVVDLSWKQENML